MIWLRNKIAEKDTLDAVNAEICYNVIMDLKRQNEKLGAIYHRTRTENREQREELDQLKSVMDGYIPVKTGLPEEWTE